MAGKSGNGMLVVGGLGLLALLAFAGSAKAATPAPKPAPKPTPAPVPQGGGGGGGGGGPTTVAGCAVDAGYPFGNASAGGLSQAALTDLLTNPTYTSAYLQQQAQAQSVSGFPLVAACIQLRSLGQQQAPQGSPPSQFTNVAGCALETSSPYASVVQSAMSDPNMDSTTLNGIADSVADQNYPLAEICLRNQAQLLASQGK